MKNIQSVISKVLDPVAEFIGSKTWLSNITGLAYITTSGRKHIIDHLRDNFPNPADFEVAISKKVLVLNRIISVYQYIFVCASFLYGFYSLYSNARQGFFVAIGFYAFLELTFFSSFRRDVQKFVLEAYAVVAASRYIRLSQKPQKVETRAGTMEFFLQDILVIKYFLFLSKEDLNPVNFKYLDVQQLKDVLYKEWTTIKTSALNRLLKKSNGKNFDFLNYNTGKNDRNRKANLNRLENISAYFSEKGYIHSKEKFEKYYF